MTVPNLRQFASVVFDCDGVILDSNRLKAEAFFLAAEPYGRQEAQELVRFNAANGGISRVRKFEHFLTQIAKTEAEPLRMSELLTAYASHVQAGLMTCAIAQGLTRLRAHLADARWHVVSGGDQTEIRSVFARRDLAQFFDGGIFGGPESKKDIVARELATKNILRPAVFLGDSKYDYAVAREFDFEFVFVSGWTEFSDWRTFQARENFGFVSSLEELLAVAAGEFR